MREKNPGHCVSKIMNQRLILVDNWCKKNDKKNNVHIFKLNLCKFFPVCMAVYFKNGNHVIVLN